MFIMEPIDHASHQYPSAVQTMPATVAPSTT